MPLAALRCDEGGWHVRRIKSARKRRDGEDGEEGEENDMREGIGEPVEEESAEEIRGEVIVEQNDARISCPHLCESHSLLMCGSVCYHVKCCKRSFFSS